MLEDSCALLGCCNVFHDHHVPVPRLSALVDPHDPAFDSIVAVLTDMIGSGVEMTPETVTAAVKMGRQRHEREERPVEFEPEARTSLVTGPVVYYVRRGNLIKIGTTRQLRQRMNSLMPDEILALEPGDQTTEASRHRQFAALREDPRGEHFFPGAALLEHVARVRSRHGAPPAGLPSLRGASRAWARDLEETDRLV